MSGAGAWLLAGADETHLVLLIVACLGIGHAMCVAPGVAFATKVCQPEAERHGRTTMLGVLRMMERIGSVAGPAAAAAIAVSIGFGPAIGAIGASWSSCRWLMEWWRSRCPCFAACGGIWCRCGTGRSGMKILVCTKRDLTSLVAMNVLLPALRGHEVRVMLAERTRPIEVFDARACPGEVRRAGFPDRRRRTLR